MNSKRVKKATGVVTDFLGTEYNPEDLTAVSATAARYVIPLTGAGIALAGLGGLMGGDSQEQGQLGLNAQNFGAYEQAATDGRIAEMNALARMQ